MDDDGRTQEALSNADNIHKVEVEHVCWVNVSLWSQRLNNFTSTAY